MNVVGAWDGRRSGGKIAKSRVESIFMNGLPPFSFLKEKKRKHTPRRSCNSQVHMYSLLPSRHHPILSFSSRLFWRFPFWAVLHLNMLYFIWGVSRMILSPPPHPPSPPPTPSPSARAPLLLCRYLPIITISVTTSQFSLSEQGKKRKKKNIYI